MSWKDALSLARATVGKDETGNEPSDKWKRSMLLSEHSPIRAVTFKVELEIPYWVSVHLTRHKIGVEHFVRTQRSDRTGIARDDLPQGAIVRHTMLLNAQAAMTISRKRLCAKASPATKIAWVEALRQIRKQCAITDEKCVPECIYRGFCPEENSCGLANNPGFGARCVAYRWK